MVLYGQMSLEQSFQDNEFYREQHKYRVPNRAIRDNAIFTALAPVEGLYLPYKSITFPVRVESVISVEEPQSQNPIGTVAMNMVLLDQDFRPRNIQPFEAIAQDGIWQVNEAIPVDDDETGLNVRMGYFLLDLPDDPQMRKLTNDNDEPDPHSIIF